MKFPISAFLKGIPLLTVSITPFAGFYILNPPKEHKLHLKDLGGLRTKVYLFSDNLKVSSDNNQVSLSNSQENSGQSSKSSKSPILFGDFDLGNLDREELHKYCIPNGTNLVSVSTQASSSPPTSQPECNDWKVLGNSPTNEDSKNKMIRFLLQTISKLLQTEHAYNILALSDEKTNFVPPKVQTSNGKTSKVEEIKKTCELSFTESGEVLKHLFLSPIKRGKKCIPSPSSFKVKLSIKKEYSKNSERSQEQTTTLTPEMLSSRGIFQGRINYSLFDYWAKPKNDSTSQKQISFTFKTGNRYLFNGAEGDYKYPLSLKKLFDSLENDSLKLKDFFDR